MTPGEALLTAWERWDTHPGHPETAAAMVKACREAAEALGVPLVALRWRLALMRRGGLSRAEAVAALGAL